MQTASSFLLMTQKIPADKKRHFYVGILMGIVLQVTAWWLLPLQPVLATLLVLVAVVAISYGFELFSKITGRGIYDFADAVASVLGGVAGMAITILSLWLIAAGQ